MAAIPRVQWWKLILVACLATVVVLAAYVWHLSRRALPKPQNQVAIQGISGPVDILWDEWGVPHIFATTDSDAAFGLGWAVARDRLFQLMLLKHLTQGRLSELVGADAIKTDRLFRTMDFHGQGKRMLAHARPEVRAGVDAYTAGVNAYARQLGSNLPVEFSILRIAWEPLAADDMLGLSGLLVWILHDAWQLDPLFHKLEEKLGADRAAGLFPDAAKASQRGSLAMALPEENIFAAAQHSAWGALALPPQGASNSWVVAPSRSASGHALLSSDPHLMLGIPGFWYDAHLSTPASDLAGVTLPGFPAVIIGHNRHIAWGLTTLMTDAGDFFVEKLDPGPPLRAMYKGRWVPVDEQKTLIRVRGGKDEEFTIRRTPHGPLVADLLPDQKEALAYQWMLFSVPDANDLEGFYSLDKATSWKEFRSAINYMGAVAQNFTYADREGHIGMQTSGRVPIRKGPSSGLRIRKGWDGSEDWEGFIPFDQMPNAYDPPEGWIATSNNLPFDRPTRFYLAARYEPPDRYNRIRERLSAEKAWTPEGFSALENDVLWPTARQWAPRIAPACATDAVSKRTTLSEIELEALKALQGWDGRMDADQPAAMIFAEFYRQWFRLTFADELGEALMKDVEEIPNLPGNFLRVAWERHPEWFDRVDTPEKEGVDSILCLAFRKAVSILQTSQGDHPTAWRWGTLHQLTLTHPLSRVKVLSWYFSRGPYARPGHAQTVNKEQAAWGDNAVRVGASTRQIVDLGDPARSWSVIPGGQSGIPASAHYNDQTPLWLKGDLHPSWMNRADIEQHLSERTKLVPALEASSGQTKP